MLMSQPVDVPARKEEVWGTARAAPPGAAALT